MPSIRDLKKRIQSVKNTQQTTRAMKMVSAAKLRKAQEVIQNHRPYAQEIFSLLQRLICLTHDQSQFTSPLLLNNIQSFIPDKNQAPVRMIAITSNRGLCGGFNSNVIKKLQQWIMHQQKLGESVEVIFIGRKGYDFFKNKASETLKITLSDLKMNQKVELIEVKKMTEEWVSDYLDGKVKEVKIIFNEFVNAITPRLVIENYIPFQSNHFEVKQSKSFESRSSSEHHCISSSLYKLNPSRDFLIKKLLEKNFQIQLYRALLESQAAEHGSRMSAMENATQNAQEMIQKLTLQFNKQRQAGITKELLEIISGSESQKK